MNKDRKTYRRSPGRQYDYDPLGKQDTTGYSRSGQFHTSAQADTAKNTENSGARSGRSSGPLAPRPDPKRTRQLMRQSILASKARSALLDDPELQQAESHDSQVSTDDDLDMNINRRNSTTYGNRHIRSRRPGQSDVRLEPNYPETEEDGIDGAWVEEGADYLDYADPDLGYDEDQDLLTPRLRYPEMSRMKSPSPPRNMRPVAPADYEEDDYAYEEEKPAPARRRKKKGLTRRKLLLGLGAAAIGGVAAYEVVPKVPQTLSNVGSNIEHQLQDAFNKGVAAGAEQVRKDFVNTLESVEGVSLDAAMGAAKIMRVAYDVFVSPLVTLAATVTGDFLNLTLQALITARSWLSRIGQDNPTTLGALQAVLESWVKQVNNMPKQLQAITDADLDGAQTYLRGIQRKLQEEKAKLNQEQSTPTPRPTATPKH